MNGVVAKLLAVVGVIAALGAGVSYVRALRADVINAQEQRDTARQAAADRESEIRLMLQDADRKAKQQAQLDHAHTAIAIKLNAVRSLNRRLIDENTALRAWADTPLPDDVVRLQSSPALTGADGYIERVPDSEPVHPAGDGASHQW